MDLSRFARTGESLDSALARIERLRTCVREVWPCISCIAKQREGADLQHRPVNFVEDRNECDDCQHLGEVFEMHELENYEREQARYSAMSLFDGPHPYGFTLSLAGRQLYTYGDGVHGWGPVSTTTGAVGELVRWATAGEAEVWAGDRPVLSAGAVVWSV